MSWQLRGATVSQGWKWGKVVGKQSVFETSLRMSEVEAVWISEGQSLQRAETLRALSPNVRIKSRPVSGDWRIWDGMGWDGIGCLVEGGKRDTEEHRHWLLSGLGMVRKSSSSVLGPCLAAWRGWRGGSSSTGPWGAPCVTEAGWDWEFSIMTDKIQRGLWVEHWAGRVANSK